MLEPDYNAFCAGMRGRLPAMTLVFLCHLTLRAGFWGYMTAVLHSDTSVPLITPSSFFGQGVFAAS